MVLCSWGPHNFKRLPEDQGLSFLVEGFKYTDKVKVIYNEGSDLFEVHLSDGTKVEDVYLDNLVEVIDSLVEKTPNYEQRVQQEYAL